MSDHAAKVHTDLIHAFMAYDHAASKRDGYNIYAMPIYLGNARTIADRVTNGEDLRDVLLDSLHGRLLRAILRSLKLPRLTDEERSWGL
jgi:hypothetical protein